MNFLSVLAKWQCQGVSPFSNNNLVITINFHLKSCWFCSITLSLKVKPTADKDVFLGLSAANSGFEYYELS